MRGVLRGASGAQHRSRDVRAVRSRSWICDIRTHPQHPQAGVVRRGSAGQTRRAGRCPDGVDHGCHRRGDRGTALRCGPREPEPRVPHDRDGRGRWGDRRRTRVARQNASGDGPHPDARHRHRRGVPVPRRLLRRARVGTCDGGQGGPTRTRSRTTTPPGTSRPGSSLRVCTPSPAHSARGASSWVAVSAAARRCTPCSRNHSAAHWPATCLHHCWRHRDWVPTPA